MVDNNTLIKIVRSQGILNWPDQVNYMRLHLKKLLKGFPGIGQGHITLVKFRDIMEDDIYIYDPSIFKVAVGTPIMIQGSKILGIGMGTATGKHLNDEINLTINPEEFVYRVDCRPKITGGAGYFYFYKSKRDYQQNGEENL